MNRVISNLLKNVEVEDIKKVSLKVKGLDRNLYIGKENEKSNGKP